MTAKEFLGGIAELEKEIVRKKQRCKTLRDVATNTSASNRTDDIQKSKEKSPLENIMVKVIDLEREIEADKAHLVNLKAKVWEQLDKLTDETQKRILWLRYAERKSWQYIVSEVSFTSRYVFKLHIKAIEELEGILQK